MLQYGAIDFQDMNGSPGSPNKKIPTKLPTKEKSSSSLKPNLSRSSSKSATPKTPENPPLSEKKSKFYRRQILEAKISNLHCCGPLKNNY